MFGGVCMNYMRLGQRIREERLKLNLTQSQLAEAVDISDTYVGQIERGERSLTLDTLVRVVNRLGVSIDYLLKDSVAFTEDNILNQFRQIFDTQTDNRKQMALDVVKTMFAHLEGK
jgi:transcriptional regulator with XRE-family HTH domain